MALYLAWFEWREERGKMLSRENIQVFSFIAEHDYGGNISIFEYTFEMEDINVVYIYNLYRKGENL